MNGGLIQPQNEHRSAVDDAKTELCEEAGNENQKPGIDDTEMKTMDCANSDVDVAPASLKVTTDGVLDNNVPSNTESQALLERHVTDPESKSCSEVQMKESNDVVGSAELKHSEDEHCMRKSQNDQKLELKESKSCSEVQMKELNDVLSSGELKPSEEEHCMTKSPNDQKLELKQVMGHVEMEQTETCAKSGLKEATNDDMHSEVSNPNMSPKNVTSSSQLGVVGVNHGGCGEITSVCCRSSFAEESLCTDNLEPVNKACVVLEIPKHVRPTGIRKITFKFSKRDVGHDGDLSTDVKPFDDGNIHEGFYDNHVSMSPTAHLMGDAFQNQGWSALEHEEMSLSMDGLDFQHTQSPSYCVPNRELKMSKKIVLDNYPTNVKKLLSTRILEGASVKYISISGMKELEGIVKDGGYLCGCYICNFSKVVNAYEFELHAGVKTRHPNNHIYLENGKSITSIVKELKSAPLSTVDSVIKDVAGSSVNEEYFKVWKENLQNGNGVAYAGSVYQSRHFGMPYCTSSHFTEESPYPALYQYSHVNPFNQSSYIELPVEKKRLVKKPRKNSSNSFGEKKKAGEGGNRKRDNDLHKLLFMPNGLPDGTSLAYYSKGKKILGGHKQGNGIFCTCCNCEISPSQFEAHAGWSAKRQPYRHIYTSSGLTLHDIALMLANGQNITSSGSDDMCAVCGNRGELIICNACPRAFHADCLGLQYPPDDDWHCQYCTERFGPGRKALAESRHIILRLKRVVKAPEFEPGGCVICRSQDFSAAKFDDRTVIICDQCEKEYHVGCLRESGFCDLKELPEDKWFCRNECHNIFKTLENMSCSAPEVIPASVLDAVYEKQTKIGFNTTSKNEIQWCILNGKSRCPEHILLLSRAAAIFRECFDPIVVKSGRDLIPVMVYGRNISGQEFSGMYCVVLIVQSVVVSAALLRIFGRDVAELPLVATARENQGKGYFQALFTCIEGLLSSMSVKHLVLPAAEEAEPMWTNKLGFSKTSNEQMLRYRDFQLTVFKGTCLLEKEVQQFQN